VTETIQDVDIFEDLIKPTPKQRGRSIGPPDPATWHHPGSEQSQSQSGNSEKWAVNVWNVIQVRRASMM
jgi:hypothetical protein